MSQSRVWSNLVRNSNANIPGDGMFSTRPCVLTTPNGYPQRGVALLVNGYWAVRGNGYHIWATSPERALALSSACAGGVATTPANFVGWADEMPAAQPGPFARPAAQQPSAPASQVTTAAPRPVPQQAAVTPAPALRSPAQCRNTLRLCSVNALRCERGEIGGDLGKMRKGVLTALRNYQDACAREGVAIDEDAVADAIHAAGVDEVDAEAVGW